MQAHPVEAEKIRAAKLTAEEGGAAPETTTAEAKTADAIAAAEGVKPGEEAKPATEAAPVAGATPAKIEEWTGKSAELKAAFDKDPALRTEIMETARFAEAAKPVLDIVSTPEEAQFAVDHAQRLVSLQTSMMLAGDDPTQMEPAWAQVEDMFKERDANGAEVKGEDGKPVFGADFKPFVQKAANVAMSGRTAAHDASIAAIEARLAGNYPNDDARAADQTLLDNAKYSKAAYDFVMKDMGQGEEGSTLPALPANATPEQIEYQKKLEAQQKEFDAKQGKSTAEGRRAAAQKIDREVQTKFETVVNSGIETHIAAMKERGEYLPEFVLTDKYINPGTGKATNVSAFGAKIYLAVNAKINGNPLHVAKLASLQAMGAAGKEAREAEITRLTNLYLNGTPNKPGIIEQEVTRIQDGIRASTGKPKEPGIARVEPQSAGTVTPQPLDQSQIRQWAEAEAAKDPGWAAMDGRTREQLTISLAAKKKYGG